jgi:hypothetical protein
MTGFIDYVTIRSVTGTYWNTYSGAFEALTVANWYSAASNNYAIVLAETPASSYFYVGTFPAIAGNMVAGWYWVDVYRASGAFTTAKIGDQLIGTLLGWWDGTTYKPWAGDTLQVAGTTQTAGDLYNVIRLLGQNTGMRNTSYTGSNLTSCDICVYDTAGHAATNDGSTGLVAKYTVTNTYDGSNIILTSVTTRVV